MDCKDDFAICEEILQSMEAGEFILMEAPTGFEQRVMTRIYALEEECPVKEANLRERLKAFRLSALIPADLLENLIYIVWIIISILLGAGFVLAFNEKQIISYFSGSPQLERYVEVLQHMAQYIDGFVLSFIRLLDSLFSQTLSLLSGYQYFFLFLFAVLVMVQLFMYKRSKIQI